MSKTYDCQKCGACCRGIPGVPFYAHLTPEEQTKFLAKDLRKFVFKDTTDGCPAADKSLKTKTDIRGLTICKAFKGIIGQNCTCTIYVNRPQVCQQFEPGSAACLEVRQEFEDEFGVKLS